HEKVKLAGTVGVRVEELTPRRSVVKIANARKASKKKLPRYAQNHIGGIHACGMALAAESATGILLGMSVPDSRMPLCKSMAVDFTQIAKGGVAAVATLTEEQLADIEGKEKGEAKIEVTVTDESGKEPIQAQFVWAWIPKRRKPEGG
ncbi:unnamed protein product, partial [Laminaria digitata]